MTLTQFEYHNNSIRCKIYYKSWAVKSIFNIFEDSNLNSLIHYTYNNFSIIHILKVKYIIFKSLTILFLILA